MVDKLNLVAREMLTGLHVIRAFGREEQEEERFEGASRDLMNTQLFTSRAMAMMMPTMMFVMNGVSILIVWVGANKIDAGTIQVGEMMAVITYSCVESAKALGLPEAVIPLANAACMLATSPKSNAAYMAYHRASEDISKGLGVQPPEHLRSPLFKGYLYPHDYENHYVKQDYLPRDLIGRRYYEFGTSKTEQAAKAFYDYIREKAK